MNGCGQIIADATNVYARAKRVTEDGDRCTDPTHPDFKKFCRLNRMDRRYSFQHKNVPSSYSDNGLSTQIRSGEILEYEQLHKNPVLRQIYVKE